MQLDKKINTRSIMGACDSTIKTMQVLRARMLNVNNPTHELDWAIGGMISSMTAQFLVICNEVFEEALMLGNTEAKSDLISIQTKFNVFLDRMIDGND